MEATTNTSVPLERVVRVQGVRTHATSRIIRPCPANVQSAVELCIVVERGSFQGTVVGLEEGEFNRRGSLSINGFLADLNRMPGVFSAAIGIHVLSLAPDIFNEKIHHVHKSIGERGHQVFVAPKEEHWKPRKGGSELGRATEERERERE